MHKVPLAGRTSLGLGGPAKYFSVARSVDELVAALAWSAENKVRTLILGAGSNLVIADRGFDGLAVDLAIRGLEFGPTQAPGHVKIGAGEPWDAVVQGSVRRGLGGIECLSGIPGNTGATPIQNVGAYGQEVSDVIEVVEVLETQTLEVRRLTAAECRFGYRDSRFKSEPDSFVVLGVEMQLQPNASPALRYGELQRAVGPTPTLSSVRETVLRLRRRKSMVLDPTDPNSKSAGSFFTNPVLPASEVTRIEAVAMAQGLVEEPAQMPRFAAGGGLEKLAAAWLIEKAGISKGLRRGNVGVSSVHTLALVHHGGGTTAELLELAAHVRDRVFEVFGVILEPEPRLVGTGLAPVQR